MMYDVIYISALPEPYIIISSPEAIPLALIHRDVSILRYFRLKEAVDWPIDCHFAIAYQEIRGLA
jgi:hypothetical protein